MISYFVHPWCTKPTFYKPPPSKPATGPQSEVQPRTRRRWHLLRRRGWPPLLLVPLMIIVIIIIMFVLPSIVAMIIGVVLVFVIAIMLTVVVLILLLSLLCLSSVLPLPVFQSWPQHGPRAPTTAGPLQEFTDCDTSLGNHLECAWRSRIERAACMPAQHPRSLDRRLRIGQRVRKKQQHASEIARQTAFSEKKTCSPKSLVNTEQL